MRNFQKVVALIALSGMCLAAPAPSDSEPAKKSTKQHAAKPVMKDDTAEKLRELKALVEQQQAATQQLQQQLQQTQDQLKATQQQLNQSQNSTQQAVATFESNTTTQVQKVQADLSDVKTALSTTEVIVQKDEKKVAELEHPNSIAYKHIRITPGGFLETTEFYRSHATISDQATPFNSIPLGGFFQPGTSTPSGVNPYLSEFGITARDSRISLRADADAGTTKLTGYFEMDFFGTSPTANLNQTTSYTPRMRQAWGRAKFANGWTITGGQPWSLITLNRKGVDTDTSTVWIPNIMEAQYSVGYDWARIGELRISKSINDHASFAIAAAQGSSLVFGAVTNGVAGLASTGTGLYGNSLASGCSLTATTGPAINPVTGKTETVVLSEAITCTNTPTYSTNLAPDVIAKLAYDDPKLGHYEIKAVGRFFRDRILPTGTVAAVEHKKFGGGVGAGAIVPLVPKKVDFVLQGLWGQGVSRYVDSGQYDFVYNSVQHELQLVESLSVLTGFETHPTPKTEFSVLFGDEYYGRADYRNATTGALTGGYGAPGATNTGCAFEVAAQAEAAGAPATCTGNNRNLWNGKAYGYYDVYKGAIGTLRFGAEYDYIYRGTWSGYGDGTNETTKQLIKLPAGIAPHGVENTVFTTMRYIFP
jgi:hypothetical protein